MNASIVLKSCYIMEDFVASMLIKLEQFPCVLINNVIFTII